MLIPDELKLNKFRLVNIPSTRDIYMRLGPRVTPPSEYSGEDEDVHIESTKVEELSRANLELKQALEAEERSHE